MQASLLTSLLLPLALGVIMFGLGLGLTGEDFRRVLEEITETNISMPKSGKWANAGMVGIERAGGGGSVHRMAVVGCSILGSTPT